MCAGFWLWKPDKTNPTHMYCKIVICPHGRGFEKINSGLSLYLPLFSQELFSLWPHSLRLSLTLPNKFSRSWGYALKDWSNDSTTKKIDITKIIAIHLGDFKFIEWGVKISIFTVNLKFPWLSSWLVSLDYGAWPCIADSTTSFFPTEI